MGHRGGGGALSANCCRIMIVIPCLLGKRCDVSDGRKEEAGHVRESRVQGQDPRAV